MYGKSLGIKLHFPNGMMAHVQEISCTARGTRIVAFIKGDSSMDLLMRRGTMTLTQSRGADRTLVGMVTKISPGGLGYKLVLTAKEHPQSASRELAA